MMFFQKFAIFGSLDWVISEDIYRDLNLLFPLINKKKNVS